MVRLCQVKDYQVFLALDTSCQNIIRLLVQEKPNLMWNSLSDFWEIATPSEINYLKKLVGVPPPRLDGKFPNQEGVLFGISEAECREWAKVNPEIRSPFLCSFYPVLEIDETGNHRWHPALERLTYEFGAVQEFRQALGNRIYPTWSGIISLIEMYLEPLQTWFKHPVPQMVDWARDVYRSLEIQIDRERN